MARTQDVKDSIWLDPWFGQLPAAARLLYLWCLTNPVSHVGGLYVVDRGTMQHQSGLNDEQLDRSLAHLSGHVLYNPENGVLWVRGRAKYVRSKTSQIAASIARQVAECPDPTIRSAFLSKYGEAPWLAEPLRNVGLAPQAASGEPHVRFQVPVSVVDKPWLRSKDNVSPHASSRAREHPADVRVRELLELRDRFDDEDAA